MNFCYSVISLFIQLPFFDHQRLTSHRELRLAHLLLSAIATGYIWQDGDQGVPKVRRPYKPLTFYYSFRGIMFGCANEKILHICSLFMDLVALIYMFAYFDYALIR